MTVYNGLYYNRVTHKCKTCDKTWIFQSHFWGSDVLINIARVCVVAHFIVHHREKIGWKDVLYGVKCVLLIPILVIKTILVTALQFLLYPLWKVLDYLMNLY